MGIQNEHSKLCVVVLPSTILPDSLTNLIPVLVQIMLMPFPLNTGAAIATLSVNPYRNNTAITSLLARRKRWNKENVSMGGIVAGNICGCVDAKQTLYYADFVLRSDKLELHFVD